MRLTSDAVAVDSEVNEDEKTACTMGAGICLTLKHGLPYSYCKHTHVTGAAALRQQRLTCHA